MQPPGKEGKKIYIFGPAHMTTVTTMPIYGKKPLKIFLHANISNRSQGPGCITHHHFGTVTLCVQKIGKCSY